MEKPFSREGEGSEEALNAGDGTWFWRHFGG